MAAAPGEARHFLHNFKSGVNVTSGSFCLSMAHGSILGKPTMVVASGIGPGTAALCVMELLQCRLRFYSVSQFQQELNLCLKLLAMPITHLHVPLQ